MARERYRVEWTAVQKSSSTAPAAPSETQAIVHYRAVFDEILGRDGARRDTRAAADAKDPVTSPIRAPFTRCGGVSGPSEPAEEMRGTGVGHALGRRP
jgi:uncharacterized protein DUF1360